MSIYKPRSDKFLKRKLDYLWDIEDRFTYDKDYPLSRLLPTNGDMAEFHDNVGIGFLRSSSFLERIQMFIYWLTEQKKGVQHGA